MSRTVPNDIIPTDPLRDEANPMTDAIAVKHTGDLLERLKAATGRPDRDLDAAILVSLGCVEGEEDAIVGWYEWNRLAGRNYSHPAPLTASVDAALALVERKYPGFLWTLDVEGEVQIWHDPSPSFFEPIGTAEGETVPLAILTALLSAISRARSLP